MWPTLVPLWLAVSTAQASTTPEVELCRAAIAGDLALTKAWIRKGAEVNGFGVEYVGPPRRFFRKPNIQVELTPDQELEFFIEDLRADGGLPGSADSQDYTRYHALSCALAAPVPSRPVVDALIAAGANVNSPAPGAAIRVYLASHGVDAGTVDTYRWLRSRGASPLGAASLLVVEGRAEASPVALALLDEILADGGDSPVCAAAAQGDLAFIAHLVVDPQAPICRGFAQEGPRDAPRGLLDLAAEAGRPGVAGWLLEHGADPNRVVPPESEGSGRGVVVRDTAPPLEFALNGVHDDVVLQLLAHGADPFALDSHGDPAITYVDRDQSQAPLVQKLLDAAHRPAQAIAWAVKRAYADGDLYGEQPPGWISEVEAAARAWLDPALFGLLEEPGHHALLSNLTPTFWDDALATAPIAGIVGVLANEPGARQGDLRLAANACLPQLDDSRARVRHVLHRPFASDRVWDSFVPPQGTPRTPFGRVSGADPAIRVGYIRGRVRRVEIIRPADVRAAGCDAPALRYLELPPWQRAWEYGPTPAESALYGIPDAGLGVVVTGYTGHLSWPAPPAPEAAPPVQPPSAVSGPNTPMNGMPR